MTDDHDTHLHGLPKFTFPMAGTAPELPDPGSVAWRLTCETYSGNGRGEGREDRDTYLARFLDLVEPEKIRALGLGAGWYCRNAERFGDDDGADPGEMAERTVRTLAGLRDRLTGLEALFLGDMIHDELGLSYIVHCDVTPVLTAYPDLRELVIRGDTDLEFPVLRHGNLRALSLESTALDVSLLRNVLACDLPALEHLELWLGDESGGRDVTVDDLAPILTGDRFPALRHLGLLNSDIHDEIAAALSSAPVTAQLTSLDLSLGEMSDTGAEALLTGQPLTHLKQLNLEHHFLTEAMAQRVRDALGPAGVTVNLDWDEYAENDDDHIRYIAVIE